MEKAVAVIRFIMFNKCLPCRFSTPEVGCLSILKYNKGGDFSSTATYPLGMRPK